MKRILFIPALFLMLGGIFYNAYIGITNWQLSKWGLMTTYPLEILGCVAAILVGALLLAISAGE